MLSLVIPMYNEHMIIHKTIERLTAAFDSETELIFVNDGSSDGCEQTVLEAAEAHKNIRLVSYPDNRGKGGAVRAGILEASGDIIVCTDCDLAYGINQVKAIAGAIEEKNVDILIGSRAIHPEGYAGYSPLRKFVSRTFIILECLFSGLKLTDSQAGIKCWKRKAAKTVFPLCEVNGFAFELEALMIAQKKGFTRAEFPVTILASDEEQGHASSVHLVRDSCRMFSDIFRIRRRLSRI